MSFFETEKIYHFFYTCFRLIKSRVMLLRTYFAIITYLSVIAITGNFELDKFIMLVFCVYLGSLGTYLLNDISDYSADSHNRKVTSFTFDVNYQRFIFYFALSCGLISIILALLIIKQI
jgi:4-hydroxybenzoate polyprenyltransferase